MDEFIAGMVLKGTEIKSIRLGKVNMSDAHCYVANNEIYIKNLNITEYDKGSFYNHDPLRARKLLLNKSETAFVPQ